MLSFYSGSSGNISSRKAVNECLEKAFKNEPDSNCNLIVLFTAMGHNFRDLLDEAHRISPGARITGCTGEGVISREGADESIKALSVMAVKGPEKEIAVAGVDNAGSADPFDVGVKLALELQAQNASIKTILFYPSLKGFSFNWKRAIDGIESVFGTDVIISGGISVDNQKFITDFQFLDDRILEKGAVIIGFADKSIEALTCCNNGLEVIGTPFLVTKCSGNRILEFDGQPAWTGLTEKLDLPLQTPFMEIAPFTTIVRKLPEEFRAEYNSVYIVTSAALPDPDGSLPSTLPMSCGSQVWLSRRNEKKIFEGVDYMISQMTTKLKNRKPVAVFHSDCITRGRLSFNTIAKESIIKKLQQPIVQGDDIPWSGIYAAAQLCPLCGSNQVHLYTSSLCILVRCETS